ncbi:hypothetical protein [Negadavirga shengliensis]|uniref:PH domain-containing protein n=1 Tax=Negadavirga shengliensis TaxID=1389218 RepID=A0ABV9T7G0_9BACT
MVFKEEQSFVGTWIMYLMLMIELPVMVLLAVLWLKGELGDHGYIPLVIVLAVMGLVFWLLMSMKLETRIDRYGFQFRSPPFVNKWRKYPWDEIKQVEVKSSGAMWKFGGLGIRYNLKEWGYIFNNAHAVRIYLKNKSIVFSTRKPKEILAAWEEWREDR